jgi:hypothetical protein
MISFLTPTLLASAVCIALGYLPYALVKRKAGALTLRRYSQILLWFVIGFSLVGFAAGFFGPILLRPDANQGPLLGIFFTGPLGAAVGLIISWIWFLVRYLKT